MNREIVWTEDRLRGEPLATLTDETNVGENS